MKTVQERVEAAAVQREDALQYRSRIWRWCRRHPWLMLMAALIAAPFAYDAWRLYGWRPDVVVKGQIVDYDTKQPVEGAWVLIRIWADGRIFDSNGKLIWYVPEGGSTSMTSPMSTVVQTDKDGRFRYRVSAYDAFQYASYTKYEVAIGAYKSRYRPVSATTGKKLPLTVVHLPFTLRPRYHDWPSLKRLADSEQQPRVGISVAPSDATWPQWVRFLHAMTTDELDHWCKAPSIGEENGLYRSFLEAAARIVDQEVFLVYRSVNQSEQRTRWPPEIKSSRRHSLDADYRLAAPDFPWPISDAPSPPTNAITRTFDRLEFTASQHRALCTVMRRQSDDILKKSLDIRGPQ